MKLQLQICSFDMLFYITSMSCFVVNTVGVVSIICTQTTFIYYRDIRSTSRNKHQFSLEKLEFMFLQALSVANRITNMCETELFTSSQWHCIAIYANIPSRYLIVSQQSTKRSTGTRYSNTLTNTNYLFKLFVNSGRILFPIIRMNCYFYLWVHWPIIVETETEMLLVTCVELVMVSTEGCSSEHCLALRYILLININHLSLYSVVVHEYIVIQ